MTKRYLTFWSVSFLAFWAVYIGVVAALMPFDSPPGFYISVTAFSYTAEMVGRSLSMIMAIFLIERAIHSRDVWRAFILSAGGGFAAIDFVKNAAAFANKFYWWKLILFGDDQYGYDKTRAAASSLLVAACCLAFIALTAHLAASPKSSRQITIGSILCVLVCSVLAAIMTLINH